MGHIGIRPAGDQKRNVGVQRQGMLPEQLHQRIEAGAFIHFIQTVDDQQIFLRFRFQRLDKQIFKQTVGKQIWKLLQRLVLQVIKISAVGFCKHIGKILQCISGGAGAGPVVNAHMHGAHQLLILRQTADEGSLTGAGLAQNHKQPAGDAVIHDPVSAFVQQPFPSCKVILVKRGDELVILPCTRHFQMGIEFGPDGKAAKGKAVRIPECGKKRLHLPIEQRPVDPALTVDHVRHIDIALGIAQRDIRIVHTDLDEVSAFLVIAPHPFVAAICLMLCLRSHKGDDKIRFIDGPIDHISKILPGRDTAFTLIAVILPRLVTSLAEHIIQKIYHLRMIVMSIADEYFQRDPLRYGYF